MPIEPQNKTCRVVDLGRIAYGESLRVQQQLVAARKAGAAPDVLLLCEHPHVITLGRNGKIENLRASEAWLRSSGVEFHHTNRGGDITYHGPGQLVAYPIINLGEIRRDVVWYVRQLEEAMIAATASFGVASFRVPGCTGVWTSQDKPGAGCTYSPLEETGAGCTYSPAKETKREKLAAIGVHISRWVTSHGLAYNVSTDLSYFDMMVPCGIAGCRSTSLEKLLGRPVSREEFAPRLVSAFGGAFGLQMVAAGREELDRWLAAAPIPNALQPANLPAT